MRCTPEMIMLAEEGVHRRPGPDSEGLETIGCGRCVTRNPLSAVEVERLRYHARDWDAEPLTDDEARWLLSRDVRDAIAGVVRIYGPDVLAAAGDVRYSVLVSMCYQLGARGLAGFVEMNKAVRRYDWVAAKIEALDSDAGRTYRSRWTRQAHALLAGRIDPYWIPKDAEVMS